MSKYNKTNLPQGITVISENIPYVRSFSLGFWFNVGSRDENISQNGITHFIEHMLFKGTEKRTAGKIANEIESYGGYLNAFTSKEQTCYYGRGLSNHLEKTFDVLADMVQNATFKKNEIKKEAGVILDELYDIEDSPEELIFDKLEEIIYKDNSLSYPIIGTENNIKTFSQQDMFDFINHKYGFDRLLISASGNIDHNELLRLVDKYLKKDLGKSNIIRNQNEPFKKKGEEFFIDKEIQQVHTIIGKPVYGYKSEKRITCNLLTQILGEGSSSRLFQAIRERNGITYQINSFLNSYYDVSSFGVYFSTNIKYAEKALGMVKKEFRKLREKKVSERELKKAKESLKGGFLLSLESTSNRMIRMAQSELYFGKIVTVEEVIEKIDSVTADEILEMSNEILDEESFVTVIIRSKDSLLKSAA